MTEKIVIALVSALLAWLEGYATKPRSIEDVNTPKALRDQWAAYLRERLRDKNGDLGQQK